MCKVVHSSDKSTPVSAPPPLESLLAWLLHPRKRGTLPFNWTFQDAYHCGCAFDVASGVCDDDSRGAAGLRNVRHRRGAHRRGAVLQRLVAVGRPAGPVDDSGGTMTGAPRASRRNRGAAGAWTGLLILACLIGGAGRAEAQIGRLVSPGPLARAHAKLEGADNCQKCHDPGPQQAPPTNAWPATSRSRSGSPRRRACTATSPASAPACHEEHAGLDADLRPFDPKAFNHAASHAFPLDGRHAALAVRKCHKTRSFLTAHACLRDVPHGHPQAEPRARLPRLPHARPWRSRMPARGSTMRRPPSS